MICLVCSYSRFLVWLDLFLHQASCIHSPTLSDCKTLCNNDSPTLLNIPLGSMELFVQFECHNTANKIWHNVRGHIGLVLSFIFSKERVNITRKCSFLPVLLYILPTYTIHCDEQCPIISLFLVLIQNNTQFGCFSHEWP